ncbi:cold-responsive protein kinase 1-like isoform X2 [Daucus carota subsp. sativus]|uniref:cold-responsive protein kinase 1-like isoform X2 n=1 Tax=Daucus carota subsp. sativus TaxID=79200 RepID=UPI0007EFAF9D|nr:PREDICTED: probable LRR receptor-like serine/threonine-protein kinase At1g56140 isoform X2 [Daucus carota subsp. sativus]
MPRVIHEAISVATSSQNLRASCEKKTASLYFFLGASVVLATLLILILVIRKMVRSGWMTKFVLRSEKQQADLGEQFHTIIYFGFQTLRKATKNFHQDNFLGRGGFGLVYMGKLEDGRTVAVKKLATEKSQQGESEFLAEVKMITSIQHKNLVRLVGCCSDGDQRLLVYEYMKNKSLDLIVYGKSDQFLNWSTRSQIILGIAKGIQYLHEDSHFRIVHRDIKASNILLDSKFQPRISDFGLARFFPEDQAYLSTTFAGTLGYTAPEYAIKGELSEKADIYSFGVLVLEIISGRKNTDLTLNSDMQYLPEYAWKLFERSKVMDLVEPRLREDGFLEREVLQTIQVAFLCLQPHADLRPPMSEVVAMLTCRVDMTATPLKPTFLSRRRRKQENWDTISDVFPSPQQSDSLSGTRPAN